jgi:hypothetical protein
MGKKIMTDRIDPKEIEFTYTSNFSEHFNESIYGIELYRHFDSLEKAHEFGKQLKDQLEQDTKNAEKYSESAIVKLIESICKALDCGELQIVDKFLELKHNEKIVKRLDNQIIKEDILADQLHCNTKDEFHITYRRDLLKKIRDG